LLLNRAAEDLSEQQQNLRILILNNEKEISTRIIVKNVCGYLLKIPSTGKVDHCYDILENECSLWYP